MTNNVQEAKPKDFIANYEMNNYKYSDFWIGREYEHASEVMLLAKIFKNHLPDLAQREIVDLGGAYGRLLPVYGEQAKHVILADYSTNELLQGLGNVVQSPLRSKIQFLALNAYKMPFGNETVDSLISVRVMHHLKEIHLFLADLERVLKPGGKAIIEFANKNHILSLLRHAKRSDLLSYLQENVVQVTHRGDAQGLKEGQLSIMYNFSYDYIKEKATELGLTVEACYACSFLRSGFLKRLFGTTTLLKIESLLQNILGWTKITPSLVVVLAKKGEFTPSHGSAMEQLVCPVCRSPLSKMNTGYLACPNNHEFQQSKIDIVDLRDPRPEEIDF